MNSNSKPRMRQLVDWSAAVWGGVISGTVFFLLNLFLTPYFMGGNIWVIVRLFASVILGEAVLAPPATFDIYALVTAIFANFVISMLFALLIAYIIHRGGLITGIIGGAILGLAIYAINFYTMTFFFPWFFAMQHWIIIVNHIIFGALAGGIYEWLEIEEFVPVTEKEEK